MKFDWSRLNWPQAIVLIVVILATVGAGAALTAYDAWSKVPWQAVGAVIIALSGGAASSFLGKLVHSAPRDPETRTRASDPPSHDIDVDGAT